MNDLEKLKGRMKIIIYEKFPDGKKVYMARHSYFNGLTTLSNKRSDLRYFTEFFKNEKR